MSNYTTSEVSRSGYKDKLFVVVLRRKGRFLDGVELES